MSTREKTPVPYRSRIADLTLRRLYQSPAQGNALRMNPPRAIVSGNRSAAMLTRGPEEISARSNVAGASPPRALTCTATSG
jgi:hypothetical protein